MLALASRTYFLEMFDLEQLHTVVTLASGFRVPASEYSWIAMGFAGVITFYLFFKLVIYQEYYQCGESLLT